MICPAELASEMSAFEAAGVGEHAGHGLLHAMKVQEVILQAMSKKITWWQAAEILGFGDRHMRCWRERL